MEKETLESFSGLMLCSRPIYPFDEPKKPVHRIHPVLPKPPAPLTLSSKFSTSKTSGVYICSETPQISLGPQKNNPKRKKR